MKDAVDILNERIEKLEVALQKQDSVAEDAWSENDRLEGVLTKLEAENERLREILHTERQAIAKRLDRIKKAASRLEIAVHGTVLDLEGE